MKTDRKHPRDPRLIGAAVAELAKLGITPAAKNFPEMTDSELLQTRADLRRGINAIQARYVAVEETDGPDADADLDRLSGAMWLIGSWINDIGMNLDLRQSGGTKDDTGKGTTWRTADGKAVRVLSRAERFADLPGGDEDGRGLTGAPAARVGFGEYVRAMVTGTTNPDIRAALSEGSDSAGGFTVPTTLLRQLIDRMRSKTVCIQAGALTLPLDTMTTRIARVATDPAAAWRNENAAIAESDPTFEGVTFTARSLAVLVKVSREVLDDSVNINEALLNAFAGAMAVELDRVALFGSGTAPEPRGVFNTTNVGSVSMGTNGAQLTNWDKVIDCLYEVESDNAGAPTGMVMHPRTRQTIAKLKDTTNQPLAIPPALVPIPQYVTTTVPTNQAQGTSGAVCSPLVLGDFAQLIFGVRQELRIDIVRERFIDNLQYAFVAHLRADVALAHPESFCKLIGILP